LNKPRIDWLDAVKGASILMVSIYHVGLIMDAYGYSITWLMKINALLTPIRMPAFFLAAGFVARSSVNRPWLYLFEKRIGFYAYLFVLWSVLRFSFFGNVVPNRLAPLEGNDWTWLISSLVAPETGAWFLWALAIFYSLTKSVESVPARVVIPIGILASVIGFSGIVPMLFSFANILQYFVFFYVACHFQHLILRLSDMPLRLIALGTPVFAVLTVLAWRSYYWWIDGPAELAAAVAGVLALIGIAVRLENSLLGSVARFFGHNTLPIYVMHLMIISWVAHMATQYNWPDHAASRLSLAVVLFLAAVVLPVVIKRFFDRIGLSFFLFRLPWSGAARKPVVV